MRIQKYILGMANRSMIHANTENLLHFINEIKFGHWKGIAQSCLTGLYCSCLLNSICQVSFQYPNEICSVLAIEKNIMLEQNKVFFIWCQQ